MYLKRKITALRKRIEWTRSGWECTSPGRSIEGWVGRYLGASIIERVIVIVIVVVIVVTIVITIPNIWLQWLEIKRIHWNCVLFCFKIANITQT